MAEHEGDMATALGGWRSKRNGAFCHGVERPSDAHCLGRSTTSNQVELLALARSHKTAAAAAAAGQTMADKLAGTRKHQTH